jgi:hypothetical protein
VPSQTPEFDAPDEPVATGVGKILKPELRHREIADALRTVRHDTNAPASRLEVINDPRAGIRVEVWQRAPRLASPSKAWAASHSRPSCDQ